MAAGGLRRDLIARGMKFESSAETISFDEQVLIAFDLSGSEPGYLLISSPIDSAATDAFFGQDHYVELQDQVFGRYGGLAALKVTKEDELEIGLNFEVPRVGDKLTIVTSEPLSGSILDQLRKLERG